MNAKKNSLFRDCPKCGEPVHARSTLCKACGGPSPWATGTKEPGPETTEPTTESPAEPVTREVDRPRVSTAALTTDRPTERIPDRNVTVTEGLRVVDTTADSLNPSEAEVAEFLHDMTAPQRAVRDAEIAEAKTRTGPHVFLDRFDCMVGNVMGHWKRGDVVTDFPLLLHLQALNAPIVPATLAPGMTCCPQCQHVFKIPLIVPPAVKRA